MIVQEGNPLNSISERQIKKIFKLKQHTWANNLLIRPANLAKSHLTRQKFSRDFLRKSAHQMEAYYLKMAMIGRGQPPYEAVSEAEMIAFVRKYKGAIGYISKPIAVEGIKVLNVLYK